jgi:hypothetical protein
MHGHHLSQLRGHEAASRETGECNDDRDGIDLEQVSADARDGRESIDRWRPADQRVQLHHDDDAADSRCEARRDGIRHQRNVASEPKGAEQQLQDPGEHDDADDRAGRASERDRDARHDDRDGAGGTRYLRRRAAEERHEYSRADGAVKTRYGAEAGYDAEREAHRQRHGGGLQAAAKVAGPVTQFWDVERPLADVHWHLRDQPGGGAA